MFLFNVRWQRVCPHQIAGIVISLLLFAVCVSNASSVSAQPIDTEEWVRYIDEAFAKPEASLLPSAVVFPTVGSDNKILEGGIALSVQANLFYELAPERKSHSAVLPAIHTFRDGGDYQPGLEIDKGAVEIYAKAFCADFYYFPILAETTAGYQLTLKKAGRQGTDQQEILSRSIKKDELLKVPGVIAIAMHEDQQGKLTNEERSYIAKPQLRDFAALLYLERLIQGDIMGVKEDMETVSWFLHENPSCFTGWLVAIDREYMHETILDRIRPHNTKVSEEVVRDLLGPADARLNRDEFRKILGRAYLYKSDPVYMFSLSEQFIFWENEKLIDHFFRKWSEYSDEYNHLESRAVAFTIGAWHIRGKGASSSVSLNATHLFEKYTERYGKTLKEAIQTNPQGWQAYMHMISYATETGTRTSLARDSFEAAVKLRPRSRFPYKYYYRYLQPRWGGDAYELLEFTKECVSTQYWGTQIPEQAVRVIKELADPRFMSGFDRRIFAVPEVWDVYTHYYKSFVEHGPDDEKQKYEKLNEFAQYGAFGGHLDEVKEAFEAIIVRGPSEKVFWDGYTFGFLHDFVRSETSTGIEQKLALLRIMLCVGAFDNAQKPLDELNHIDADNGAFYDRYQEIIDLGNEVLEQGEVKIGPQQVIDLFEGPTEYLEVQEDRLIVRVPANTKTQLVSPFGFINVDLTGNIKFVSGNGSLALNLHTRSMRDNIDVHFNRERKSVEMHRNNVRYREFLNQNGDQVQFRMRKLPEGDIISVNENPNWEVNSYTNDLSGFGLTVVSRDKEFTFEISNLKLTLLNEKE